MWVRCRLGYASVPQVPSAGAPDRLSRAMPDSTRRAYTGDLRRFLSWCADRKGASGGPSTSVTTSGSPTRCGNYSSSTAICAPAQPRCASPALAAGKTASPPSSVTSTAGRRIRWRVSASDQQTTRQFLVRAIEIRSLFSLVRWALVRPRCGSALPDADRRGLTLLFWTYVAPYGEVKLDMSSRLLPGPPAPSPST
ncbi:hypothetical protein Pa4123_44480 [Phytohabitans aurantiacus]|uniref:Core-binding (CB) domain-containing protein n=1 Tax=Phytohabitans aurantiacus TaxID=3016789 RepID=A0ABQ5QX92_9ACTN|nr:hypothetical protein Pa4123_44480 [Phytohabitans aurantiacus]